jgi:hypothetical protein
MTRLIITQRPTRKHRMIQAGTVVAVLLICWGLFEYGRYRAGFDGIAAQLERVEQAKQVSALEKSIDELREQKAILERASQIDNEAYKQLDGELGGLRDEILELNKELAFYRGIVSPQGDSGALRLQRFDVSSSGAPHTFHYQLVLTQVLASNGITSGTVNLSVEGIASGVPKSFSLNEIGDGKGKELTFRFKYFQELAGDITLPAGFVPKRVVVSVDPRGGEKLQKSYDWPS